MSDFVPVPPTNAVNDQQTRAVLDALARNLEIATDTFLDENAARAVARRTIGEAFGVGNGGTGIPGGGSIADAIGNLEDAIMKSLLWRKLGERIVIDLSQYSIDKFPALASAVNALGAAIIREETARASADEATATSLTALGTRVTNSEAAITNELTVRSSKDNSLASAINNIWAKIGGSTAAITDGALAAVTPSAASATKWDSVIAAVTDPNTGLVNSASIVQELDTYANNANSTFNAIYTVRAQVTTGGQTVMGGFGLSATSGAGSAQGPTIDFGVRADTFWIGATSATPSLATQMANNTVPFIVVTSTATYGSVTYSPGVYMKTAFIADLSVDTLKIAGNAIIVPKSVSIVPPVTGTGSNQTVLSTTLTLPHAGVIYATMNGEQGYPGGAGSWTMTLYINGSYVAGTAAGALPTTQSFVAAAGSLAVAAGTHTITVVWNGATTMTLDGMSVLLQGVMR